MSLSGRRLGLPIGSTPVVVLDGQRFGTRQMASLGRVRCGDWASISAGVCVRRV
jgi:hypothetical protein